ncbi:MAG: hypothetical protein KF729_00850 [Sandaracinaceae bacterium]|nr:hypothetical protein [Sandaracinaceae bacterium]
MRADAHISVARANVRAGQITRHVAQKLESGRAYAISTGLGMPRTWPFATSAVLEGFAKGLAETEGLADAAARLRTATSEARAALAAACDRLVERVLSDATLVGLLLADDALHVMSVGPGRVYVQREGKPKRLTAREEQKGGLLSARPSISSTPVEPGDLVLAGSVTAFSVGAVARAVSVLTEDPTTSPSILGSVLTDPAAAAGVGAAAVVLRVR